MLDGLLSRGFISKCKTLIKANKARIEVVRRRAEAKQKFLKEDLTKLLSNGLDINAYGRTGQYIAGMNLLSCYGFIELSCEYIMKQLSKMQKQGECPEECREAVASLMFAAARFSDLPELRELRDTLQQRYGSGLEVFVNQKFVENLSSKSPATANKLRVLQDIASEFSINWDSRGFEQRMATPPVAAKVDIPKAEIVTRTVLLDEKNTKQSFGEGRRDELEHHIVVRHETIGHREKLPLKKKESSSKGDNGVLFHGSHFQTGNKYSYESKSERSSSSSHGKILDNVRAGYMRNDNGIYNPSKVEATETLFHEKAEVAPNFAGKKEIATDYSDQNNTLNPFRKKPVKGSESDHSKACSSNSLPPPYVKLKENIALAPYMKQKEEKHRVSRGSKHADVDENSVDPFSRKSKSVNCSNWDRNETDHGHREQNYVASLSNTLNSVRNEPMEGSDLLKPHSNYALPPYVKSKNHIALPPYVKPKEDKYSTSKGSDIDEHFYPSSRKSSGDSSSGVPPNEPEHPDKERRVAPYEVNTYGSENIPLPKPRSIRKKHHKSSAYNVEGNFEDDGTVKRSSSSRRRDPSRKGLQTMFDDEHHKRDDEERIIDKLLIHYSKKPSSYDEEKLRKRLPGQHSDRNVGESSNGNYQVVSPPTRSISLPREQIPSSESKRLLTRVNTFQPDNQAKHVHPKLPDYDDLAARFNALRGR